MELFERFEGNPILTKDDFPDDWSVNSVLNPGVGDRDGKTLLFVRMEDREGISQLVCFCSKDGVTDWEIDEKTVFYGDPGEKGYGVEDPRLTWVGSLQKWVVVYTHFSMGGPLVSIALTEDFREFKYMGNVLPPENKDAALFPEPINNYWWLIHRPVTGHSKQIWIARSKCTDSSGDDLRRWGEHKVLLPVDGNPRWDGNHIGLSAPPLKTDKGWLILYHGVKDTPSANLYRLGLAMLSLDDPTVVTHRTKKFVMGPQGRIDFIGDVGGAIFPCGWRVDDSNQIRLYYGAADSVICYAKASFKEVIDRVMQDPV